MVDKSESKTTYGKSGKARRKVKRKLFTYQDGRCTGCQRWFPYRNMTVDHIKPQAAGGGHTIDNLQLLCGACNSKKGVGSQDELLSWLAAEGVIRMSRSLITRHDKGYEPAGEGTMSPVAAAVVPVVSLALPYVVAGVVRTMEIAYEHRAEIKQEAEKQKQKVKGIKLPEVRMPQMPNLTMFKSRHEKWNDEQAERMSVQRWWWWTASGSEA